MRTQKNFKSIFVIVMALVMALALTGCGQNGGGEAQKKGDYEPFTIKTYNVDVSYDKIPKKVVSFNVHTTENLMALGLTDKIIGTCYGNADVLPKFKKAFDKIPSLSDQYPSMEVLLKANPDFVYGRSSAFDEKGVNTVKGFVDAGITPYVCKPTYLTGAKIEDVYEDFENLGKIFNIPDKAKEVIDGMKAKISKVHDLVKNEKPKKVFVYDSGDTQAFTAGSSLQSDLIKLAGGENIFADKPKTWETVSWESIVKKNPEYIVINDYGDTPYKDKVKFLKSQPAIKDLPAVKNNKFIKVALPSIFAGIRNADAVETIAKGLYPDLVK